MTGKNVDGVDLEEGTEILGDFHGKINGTGHGRSKPCCKQSTKGRPVSSNDWNGGFLVRYRRNFFILLRQVTVGVVSACN